MDKIPVICIITSASCGHCNKMRNTGDIIKGAGGIPSIPGGHSWNESFFKRLLFGGKELGDIKNNNNPSVRVYEVYFGPMGFKPEDIFNKVVEFSEIVWTGSKVQRNKYRPEYNKNDEAKTSKNPHGNLRVVSVIDGISTTHDLSFIDFLSLNIPTQMHSYIRLYPSWMMAKGDTWNYSIESNNPTSPYYPLAAYIPGLTTISKNDNNREIFGVEMTANGKMDDILLTERDFLSGKIKIPSITTLYKNSKSNEITYISPKQISSPEIEGITRIKATDIENQCIQQGYIKSANNNISIPTVLIDTTPSCQTLGYKIIQSPLL